MSGEETADQLKTAGDYDDVLNLARELQCDFPELSLGERMSLAYQVKIAGLLQEVADNTATP